MLAALVAAAGAPFEPGDHSRTVEVGGRIRSYIVHVPSRYNPEVPTPVVLAFHGGGHTWPGRATPLRFLGTATSDISANDLMWAFFQKHPKP